MIFSICGALLGSSASAELFVFLVSSCNQNWPCFVMCLWRGRVSAEFLALQERAEGPLSPCQDWWGSDLTHRRGGQKC